MELETLSSLKARAQRVAEVASKLSIGLQQLQQELNGALDHVDTISQQIGTVQDTIQVTWQLLNDAPERFPPSCTACFLASTNAVDLIIQKLQDHVHAVQAKRSTKRRKAYHMRNAYTVMEWKSILGVQIQTLALIVEAARLHSIEETTSMLEQSSTKALFARASSMSAKIVESSYNSACEPTIESREFSFDHECSVSGPYLRAFESNYKQSVRREISVEENTPADNASDKFPHVEVSSASDFDDVSYDIVDVYENQDGESEHDADQNNIPSESVEDPATASLVPFETSISSLSTQSSTSSRMNATELTMATTISSNFNTKSTAISEESCPSTFQVLVEVDGLGEDKSELHICEPSDSYRAVLEAIENGRDRVLISRGFEPVEYNGRCLSRTIETEGQTPGHFPLSDLFLAASLQQVEEGYYTSLVVRAHFASPNDNNALHGQALTTSNGESFGKGKQAIETMNKYSRSISFRPYDVKPTLPFIEDIATLTPTAKGGFGQVFKVQISSSWLETKLGTVGPRSDTQYVAVKEIKRHHGSVFEAELKALRACSTLHHPHITKLVGSFENRTSGYLVFPWADGSLLDFWNERLNPQKDQSKVDWKNEIQWVCRQLLGLTQGLEGIHSTLNPHMTGETALSELRPRDMLGRHGDIKPSNILWFQEDSKNGDGNRMRSSTLKISDMGLARFHSTSGTRTNSDQRRLGYTRTYRPPETERIVKKPMSSASDIWSLGCVYMEFITWFLLGDDKIVDFQKEKRRQPGDGAYFMMYENRAVMHPKTMEQLRILLSSALKLDPYLLQVHGRLIFLTLWCLEIDPGKRPTASALATCLSKVCRILDDDQEVATKAESAPKDDLHSKFCTDHA